MTSSQAQEVTLEEALNLALRHMNLANYRVAEMTLRDILASVPDHHPSMFYLGMALYHMGNTQECLKYLKASLEGEEATSQWYSNYGAILNDMGRQEEAIEAFTQAHKVDPKDAMALWNMSYAYWLMDDFKQSEKAGEKAVKLDPKSAEAWLNLGAAKVKLGKEDDAIKCWRKAVKIEPNFSFAWNNLGNVLRDQGKLEEAEECLNKALEVDPNNVDALNNMGNVFLDRGEQKEAEKWYRKTIANKPDHPEGHNNLCIVLMNQSNYEEAAMHGRYAVSFRPNYADAYVNLSEALRNLGQIDEARRAIEQAVVLRPDSAEVHMDVADILFMQDKYADAEVELKKAEKEKPDNPRMYLKLASVQERAGNTEDALKTIQKAIKLNPKMPEPYIRQGQIYHVANRSDEAEASYMKAKNMAPKHPSIYVSLADLYLTRGDLKKAEKMAGEIKKLAPNTPGLFHTLAHIKKFKKTDPEFKKMVEMEKTIISHGLDAAAVLNFTLYKAYEDVGEYKKAFEHLKKGNDYKRLLVPYDQERQKLYFDSIKKKFSKKYLKTLEGKGYSSDIPVFILGMPRSGTTLTEQIISSHPAVYGAGELDIIATLEREIGPLSEETCKDLGAFYVKQIRKLDKTKKAKHITDKMPGNFANIGLIASILPNAKIIHCRRDPIDNCLSCYKQNFARGQYWSYDLEELAEQHKQYQALMEHWRKVLPGRFLEIDYEETVADLETQARKLIDYIGLPWNKACLMPHKQKRTVLTASKTQVIKPVYKSSVKSWKRYAKQLKPLIDGLKEETESKPTKTATKAAPKKATKKTRKKTAKTAKKVTKKTAKKTTPKATKKTVKKPVKKTTKKAVKKTAGSKKKK